MSIFNTKSDEVINKLIYSRYASGTVASNGFTFFKLPINSVQDMDKIFSVSDDSISVSQTGLYRAAANVCFENFPVGTTKYILALYKNDTLYGYLSRGFITFPKSDFWGLSGLLLIPLNAGDNINYRFLINPTTDTTPPVDLDLFLPLSESLTADTSGNSYDFTATNVSHVVDTFYEDKVAYFNGTNATLQRTVVSGGLNADLNLTNLSFGCFFRTSTNDGLTRTVITIFKETNRQLTIYIKDGKIVVYLRRVAVPTLRMTTNDSFDTDEWVHVAATVEDGVGAKLYINGSLYTNLTYNEGSAATDTIIDTSSATVKYIVGSNDSIEYFEGHIANVFLVGSTLSVDDVIKLARLSYNFCTTQLELQYIKN